MKIVISGTLQRFAGYRREHEVDATTVHEALGKLVDAIPTLGPIIFDDQRQLKPIHRLFLNREQLAAAHLNQALHPHDRLEILTAIAGG